MKKKLHIGMALVMVIISGCGLGNPKKEIVASVNNYEITKDEFEEEFRGSLYGQHDTLEARQEFLQNLINQKLILQDAQEKGLDKETGFLKMIEKFWEQSLLKISLDKKAKEIARARTRGGSEPDIKKLRLEESQEMNAWVGALRKKAKLTINEELLKIHK